ncbi:hypothetical protein AVEN_68269-1 [Araneus ventricosus]|uniref:Uncharacterized protein n=1 Tax=Araneus ventricosus TaxID=182803 RepID=A0A4Y2X4V1_ARAVE|nr:hypothetical protein AVEN_68269-1 [Araneus ventricosus]
MPEFATRWLYKCCHRTEHIRFIIPRHCFHDYSCNRSEVKGGGPYLSENPVYQNKRMNETMNEKFLPFKDKFSDILDLQPNLGEKRHFALPDLGL